VPQHQLTSAVRRPFFIEASGAPLWQICQSLSEYYSVNIVVYDDVKDKPIYANVSGISVVETLNCISWLIGVEWMKRENVYYVGGNADNVSVFPSSGLDSKLEVVFGSSVRIVNDKIIIQGTERNLKKIGDSISKILQRNSIRLALRVIEITYDDSYDIGFEWKKAFEYGADWKNMLSNVSPITHLAASVAVASHLDETYVNSRVLIDTELSVLSGSSTSMKIGEEVDRPIYTTSDQGTRVQSGYSTLTTGLIVTIKAYEGHDSWVFDSSVENSKPVSDTYRTTNKIESQFKAKSDDVCLLGTFRKQGDSVTISSGIPFLNRIPWIGKFFGVHDFVKTQSDVYFCIRVLPASALISEPPKKPQPSIIEDWKKFGNCF